MKKKKRKVKKHTKKKIPFYDAEIYEDKENYRGMYIHREIPFRLHNIPEKYRNGCQSLYWGYRCIAMIKKLSTFNCSNAYVGEYIKMERQTVKKYQKHLRKHGLIGRRQTRDADRGDHGHFKSNVWITIKFINDETIKRDAEMMEGLESIEPQLLIMIKNQDREIGILQKYIAKLIEIFPNWYKSFKKPNRRFIKLVAKGIHFDFDAERRETIVKKTKKKKVVKKIEHKKTNPCPHGYRYGIDFHKRGECDSCIKRGECSNADY